MRGLRVEFDREVDGRWIADIPALPGVTVYGRTRKQALAALEALAVRVIADRLEHGEAIPRSFVAKGASHASCRQDSCQTPGTPSKS